MDKVAQAHSTANGEYKAFRATLNQYFAGARKWGADGNVDTSGMSPMEVGAINSKGLAKGKGKDKGKGPGGSPVPRFAGKCNYCQ